MPNSAVTGRTLDEIAADKKRVWHSNRSAKEQSKAAKRLPSIGRSSAKSSQDCGAPHSRKASRANAARQDHVQAIRQRSPARSRARAKAGYRTSSRRALRR